MDIENLTKQINGIADSLNGSDNEEIPKPEIPEKHWWQFKDIFSRQDDLLEQILLELKKEKPTPPPPEIPPSPPPTPPVPPIEPIPFTELERLIKELIKINREIRKSVGGLSFVTGQLSVQSAGTRNEMLHQFDTYRVIIRARASNTGNIYIGSKGVSSAEGHILGPGEPITLNINAREKAIYIDSDVSGDGVSWIAMI